MVSNTNCPDALCKHQLQIKASTCPCCAVRATQPVWQGILSKPPAKLLTLKAAGQGQHTWWRRLSSLRWQRCDTGLGWHPAFPSPTAPGHPQARLGAGSARRGQLCAPTGAENANTAHENRLFLEAVRAQHFLPTPPWRTTDALSPSIPKPAFHNFCYLPQHREARDNLPRTASDNSPACDLALRAAAGICCQSSLKSINRCLFSCHRDEQNIKCFYLWHWFSP